jgi:hypothetical protein
MSSNSRLTVSSDIPFLLATFMDGSSDDLYRAPRLSNSIFLVFPDMCFNATWLVYNAPRALHNR